MSRSSGRLLLRLRDRATSPTAATLLLSLGLAAGATLLLRVLPVHGAPLPGPGGPLLPLAALGLFAGVLAAELNPAHVDIRRQSYSFSLVCLPLVLGILFLPAPWVVAARLVAALVAFRIQRSAPVKVAYNISAYLLDVALVLTVVRSWSVPGDELTARTALVAYLALAVVDALMTALVLVVIRVNSGPLGVEDLRESFGPAFVTVSVATALGLQCAVLLQAGSVGAVLLGLVAGISAVAYRGYLVLRRRHSDLRRVQGYMGGGPVEEGRGTDATDLVDGIRDLLRADTVRLAWSSRDGERQWHVSSETPAALSGGMVPPPPGTHGLVPAGTTDPALRTWLGSLPAREALVVGLDELGGNGLLVVTDRLGGEVSSFTGEDAALAEALAAHLVVRLRNTELVDRLRWEATHDALTRLPDRRVLLAALELHLPPPGDPSSTEPPAHGTVVVVVGLDNLHEVNDALGHAVGDELLVEVARRLAHLPEPGAAVARLSGEYFAVSLPVVRRGEAVATAHRIRAAASGPVTVPGAVVSVSARVGVAVTDGTADAAELLRRADAALACARSDGRPVAAYEPSMDSGRSERLALLGDLHRALEDRTLTVHYQPKLDLVAGRVSGAEALVRWKHPVLGAISPTVFVPVAESAGLVDQLTDLVLGEALAQAASWAAEGLDLKVAVNLSARSLDDERLPERVAAALALAGVAGDRLVLEITETSIMGSPERTLPVLHRLVALGLELSLDDFGTGYSSLGYLRRLPVDELKIDRSFVMALEDPSDSDGLALVRTVLSLAAGLGLRVVAEGVESARAMAVLRAARVRARPGLPGLPPSAGRGPAVGRPCHRRGPLLRGGPAPPAGAGRADHLTRTRQAVPPAVRRRGGAQPVGPGSTTTSTTRATSTTSTTSTTRATTSAVVATSGNRRRGTPERRRAG